MLKSLEVADRPVIRVYFMFGCSTQDNIVNDSVKQRRIRSYFSLRLPQTMVDINRSEDEVEEVEEEEVEGTKEGHDVGENILYCQELHGSIT